MKNWRLTIVFLLIICFGIVFFAGGTSLFSSRVYAGVTVDGVSLEGCSREDVQQLLAVWRQELLQKKIKVYYGENSFDLAARQIDLDWDVAAAADEAWNYGRDGGLWTRMKKIYQAREEGYHVTLRVQYNKDKLDRYITKWRQAVEREPRNAAISVQNGTVLPQEQGMRLAVETAGPAVLKALSAVDVPAVILPVVTVPPEVTVQDVAARGIGDLWGSYITEFNEDDANRSANIILAANKINGKILEPGAVFSFNEVVGPREKEYGFKEAMELVDGELVPGVGGGICQVSSTLYNAVLLSNLTIVERYNHSKALGYVPLGRDATVVYGLLDFKFANNTGEPVLITAEIYRGRLSIGLFGREKMKEAVKIISTDKKAILPAEVRKEDQTLYLGETEVEKPGKPGYEITTLRIVESEGQEIKREVLAKDRYLPEDKIIKMGTRMPPFARAGGE